MDLNASLPIAQEQAGRTTQKNEPEFASLLEFARSGPQHTDMRWDDTTFNMVTNHGVMVDGRMQYAFAWLRVGYARRVHNLKGIMDFRNKLPPGALVLGSPPADVQLFKVIYRWNHAAFNETGNPDPHGGALKELVEILDREQASDDDLIWWSWVSMNNTESPEWLNRNGKANISRFVNWTDNGVLGQLNKYCDHCSDLFATYWRIKPVVIFDAELLERKWILLELFLGVYCQRVLFAEHSKEMMRTAIDPLRLSNPRELFANAKIGDVTSGDLHRDGPWANEMSAAIWKMLLNAVRRMVSTATDSIGFELFCNVGNIAWLTVEYVHAMAEQSRAQGTFPFPRRQELQPGRYIVGAPPRGCRKFVVSHGWETEVHPSPSGRKMIRLSEVLRTLEAGPSDVVFFDFCSNPQEAKMGCMYAAGTPFEGAPARSAAADAYFDANAVTHLRGRSAAEAKAFSFAMWDMGRLYAYQECEVIVLPELDGPDSFPKPNSAAPHVWGLINQRAYERRGWCASEFSIALYNNRIANLDDEAVQHVLKSRGATGWPQSIAEYSEMMRYTCDTKPSDGLVHDATLGVDFTHKGDRAVVLYNFFKMTMGPQSFDYEAADEPAGQP